MIDLNKLNTQFDLNNIDTTQILKFLSEQQKNIIYVFIIGSLLMVWGMFNAHHLKEAALRTQMSQEQAKLDVIKARDTAIGELTNFKSSVPKALTVFDLITLISNYARSNNSNISSYLPEQNKDMGLYDVINVNFTAESDNFKDMMLFLRKVEKSSYPIMIKIWSGHKEVDGRMNFTIVISAVLIHP